MQIEKSLVTPEPLGGFQPGNTVTFKLKMCIPSGDTKNIEFKDFLPSPIFNASSVFGVSFTQSPSVGATLDPPMPNSGDNSIKFTNKSTVITGPSQLVCFEVTFSVLVTTAPFADDLYLSSNNVTILINNGTGTFTAPNAPFASGNSPSQVAVSDFNGDLKPDLVTVGQFSNVNILFGTGTGTFGAPTATNVTGGPDPYSVAVTDFNNDGKADLAIGNLGSSQVYVLLGDGNGTFTTAPGTPNSTGAITSFLVLGDFNNDTKPDIATANRSGNNVTILLGNGNGSFTAAAPALHCGVGPSDGTFKMLTHAMTDLIVDVAGYFAP